MFYIDLDKVFLRFVVKVRGVCKFIGFKCYLGILYVYVICFM